MLNNVNVCVKNGYGSTKAAQWTIRTTKQLERGQFLRRQNWSEENDRIGEYVARTRVRRGKEKRCWREKDEGRRRDVKVG
jgi:hypothetical protein